MGFMVNQPQLIYLPSQTPLVEFTLVFSYKRTNIEGEAVEYRCFIDCKLYGKRAERVDKYFDKGDRILVDGRLMLDNWETIEGEKKSKIKMLVEQFSFVNSKGKNNAGEPKSKFTEEEIPF
jgi:single-strand DNA-binding protein